MVLDKLFRQLKAEFFGHFPFQNPVRAYFSSSLCVFTAHKMSAAGTFTFNLAAGSYLYPLFNALMGLLFRHK